MLCVYGLKWITLFQNSSYFNFLANERNVFWWKKGVQLIFIKTRVYWRVPVLIKTYSNGWGGIKTLISSLFDIEARLSLNRNSVIVIQTVGGLWLLVWSGFETMTFRTHVQRNTFLISKTLYSFPHFLQLPLSLLTCGLCTFLASSGWIRSTKSTWSFTVVWLAARCSLQFCVASSITTQHYDALKTSTTGWWCLSSRHLCCFTTLIPRGELWTAFQRTSAT